MNIFRLFITLALVLFSITLVSSKMQPHAFVKLSNNSFNQIEIAKKLNEKKNIFKPFREEPVQAYKHAVRAIALFWGTLILSFLGLLLSYNLISIVVLMIGFALWIASFIYAIKGVKQDKNPKLAKIILVIHFSILVVTLIAIASVILLI